MNISEFIASTGLQILVELIKSSTSLGGTGVFISPLSIYCALVLAYNGAGLNSTTQIELRNFLSQSLRGGSAPVNDEGFNTEVGQYIQWILEKSSSNEDSTFQLANGIWTRSLKINEDYALKMKDYYNATVSEAVNGATDVNEWVSKVTNGEIKKIIDSDSFNVILANALYFKGFWVSAFNKDYTRKAPFYLTDESAVDVNMMYQEFQHKHGVRYLDKSSKFRGIAIPYRNTSLAAIAVLPAANITLDSAAKDMLMSLKEFRAVGKISVNLPKFRAEGSFSLLESLRNAGLKTALSSSANFSRIADGLVIGDVLHKTVVDVDEEGTVAAAATAVIMLTSMPLGRPLEISFDRPFIMAIVDMDKYTPIFLGAVLNPSV